MFRNVAKYWRNFICITLVFPSSCDLPLSFDNKLEGAPFPTEFMVMSESRRSSHLPGSLAYRSYNRAAGSIASSAAISTDGAVAQSVYLARLLLAEQSGVYRYSR